MVEDKVEAGRRVLGVCLLRCRSEIRDIGLLPKCRIYRTSTAAGLQDVLWSGHTTSLGITVVGDEVTASCMGGQDALHEILDEDSD